MAFRGKVHNDIRRLFAEKLIDGCGVCDIGLHEAEVRMLHRLVQCCHIACIGQRIKTDNPVLLVVFQLIIDKVAADKAGAARNNNRHAFSPS